MQALQIIINGKKVCTVGIDDLDALHAIVSLLPPRSGMSGAGHTFQVRGMIDLKGPAKHWKWIDKKIKVGDEITIRFVNATRITKPKQKYRAK